MQKFSLEYRDNLNNKRKRKKIPSDLPDYSLENVKKCLDTVVGSLRSSGLIEKANVIQKVFENHSDIYAIKLNNIIEGKKDKNNEISLDEATALQVFLNLSRTDYYDLKAYTDSLGHNFLPPYYKVKEEKEKCLPKECNFDDDEATATIKSTCDKYMDRLWQDLDEKEKRDKLVEKYKNKIKFKLLYKLGYDGSTQTRYKVRNILIISFEASLRF